MPDQEDGKPRGGTPTEDLAPLARHWRYWMYRYKIREFFRFTVTGILLVTALGFVWNFFWHLGAEYLAGPLAHNVTGRVTTVLHSLPFRSLVIGFLVYLTWNHWKEAQKPRYEYAFVRSLCDFQLKLRETTRMTLAEALGHFYPLFDRLKVDFLAVFLRGPDGNLTVGQNRYPTDRSPEKGYFPVLGKRQGVGGLVAYDSVTRYMPWCSIFESWWILKNWELQLHWPILKLKRKPFRHALRLDFSKGSEARIDECDLGIFAVSPAGKEQIPFRSLLCVPLAHAGKSPGFLQCTFSKSKSLDLSDITMAVVIGLVLGEALDSLKIGTTGG